MSSLAYGIVSVVRSTDPHGSRDNFDAPQLLGDQYEHDSQSENTELSFFQASYDHALYDYSRSVVFKHKGRNLRLYSMPDGGCVMHAIRFCIKRGVTLDSQADFHAFVQDNPDGVSHEKGSILADMFRIPFFDIHSSEFASAMDLDIDLLFPSKANPQASRSWIIHNTAHAYVLQDARSEDTGANAEQFFKIMDSYNKGVHVSGQVDSLLKFASKKMRNRKGAKKQAHNPNYMDFKKMAKTSISVYEVHPKTCPTAITNMVAGLNQDLESLVWPCCQLSYLAAASMMKSHFPAIFSKKTVSPHTVDK